MCVLCRAKEAADRIDALIRHIDGDGFLSLPKVRAELAGASAILNEIRGEFSTSTATIVGTPEEVIAKINEMLVEAAGDDEGDIAPPRGKYH